MGIKRVLCRNFFSFTHDLLNKYAIHFLLEVEAGEISID